MSTDNKELISLIVLLIMGLGAYFIANYYIKMLYSALERGDEKLSLIQFHEARQVLIYMLNLVELKQNFLIMQATIQKTPFDWDTYYALSMVKIPSIIDIMSSKNQNIEAFFTPEDWVLISIIKPKEVV